MLRTSVVSSNLESVGYDNANQILEIQFHSGGIYQYFAVPESVYQELMSASSHGGYFAAYIKNVYRYRKVS